VYDYTLTGAPSPDRMVTTPTVTFAAKVPTLTATQRAGVRLSQLEVKDDTVTAILSTRAGKLKVQAKDPVTGGPNAHQILLGKDSPQVATKTFQDGSTTRWSVASGGRLGRRTG